MTSREKVKRFLAGENIGTMPLSFGALPTDGICAQPYARLCRALGYPELPIYVYDLFQMLALVDPAVNDAVGGDFVPAHRMRYRFDLSRKTWRCGTLWDGTPCRFPGEFHPETLPDGGLAVMQDGKMLAKMPKNGLYFDLTYHPLAGVTDPKELFLVHPATPMAPDEVDFVVNEIETLYRTTDKAVTLIFGASIFEQGQRDFGHEDFYCNLALEPDLMHAYFGMLTEVYRANLRAILSRAGDKVEVVHFFDDIGTQKALQISIPMYRELVFPYHRQLCDLIHGFGSHLKVLMHCCGAIYDLIPSFIDAGVDILNPIQVSADGMDPKRLKQAYGRDLFFWGGGADTQKLAGMTPDEVRKHVASLVEPLGDGGRYVFSQVHNFQNDISAEQMLAVFETARLFR